MGGVPNLCAPGAYFPRPGDGGLSCSALLVPKTKRAELELGDERSQFQALPFNLFSDLGRQAILKVVDGIKRRHGVSPTGFMVPQIANL